MTLYIGVTSDISRRLHEHKQKYVSGITAKYNIDMLIYMEEYANANEALMREKQLKNWSRSKKLDLIRRTNPTLQEIYL